MNRFILFILACLSALASYAQDTTVFRPIDAPPGPRFNDGQGIVTGMKFRSSIDGYITGLRYYKATGTTGTHTGTLWNNTGGRLGEAVYYNETASGWQQTIFSAPVAIRAGVTYVVACYSSSGDYVATNPFFTQPLVNGPLTALANNEDGPNGAYVYAGLPVFPTNHFETTNYWVDVLFNTVILPDVTAPAIASVSPASAATGVNINSTITVNFNEPIDPSTVSSSSFELRDATNTIVSATISASSSQAILTPASSLVNGTVYSATIKGGAAGVKDLAGNALMNNYTWSFTIAPVPPPEGPGGPILVLSSTANPFSRFAIEMLKAEGLNEFKAKDILQASASDLTNYDVVILGEINITAAQAAMLTDWVNAGGTLITFRPSAQLSSLLGITKITGSLSDKYILINTAAGTPGAGIVGETIQFHGTSDLYTLNGATSLATLYTDANTASPYPAITTRTVGSNGGRAIAFTYDLARSIVYTRQGNPAWAGQKRDGQTGPIRSDDLYFGNGQPDYIDFSKITIPQADEQQRLLTNMIIQGNLHRKPLPRFWFLPSGHKAAIVMTGDDHNHDGTTGQFNYFKTLGPNSPQDVADWKAIRGTSYIYTTTLTNAQATAFDTAGFEIALHLSTGCADFTAGSLQGNFNSQMPEFMNYYAGLPHPVTNRNHCIAWSDWASAAKVQAKNGIRLDANYYYWPAPWVQNRPGLFTGSGLPMRFADADGSLIDCYQLVTQMSDESAIDYSNFANVLLDNATGSKGYYGVFCTNMHTDSSFHSGANAIIASALAHHIPVIAARQLLKWLDGRDNAFFGPMTWNNGQLSFTITADTNARNLKAMLPVHSDKGDLKSITKNGSEITFTTQTIKGIAYAFFDVSAGTASYTGIYYSGPPIACTVTSTVTSSFNSSSIASGKYIWFNSVFDPSNTGNGLVNFYVSNATITYTVNNQQVVLNVPDAHVKIDPSNQSIGSDFVNGVWETVVPANYNGNVFLSGLAYKVPANLPANISNIKWKADISSDKAGVSLNWKWAAAVYSNFSTNANIDVKPIDGALQLLGISLSDKAATPLNYKSYVIQGGTNTVLLNLGIITVGILNNTGNYSAAAAASCTAVVQTAGRSAVPVETELVSDVKLDAKFDVKAMPNPSASHFNLVVTGNAESTATIQIVDMLGRVVERHEKILTNTILTIGEGWRNGTYIAEITQGNERRIIKLVKAN